MLISSLYWLFRALINKVIIPDRVKDYRRKKRKRER